MHLYIDYIYYLYKKYNTVKLIEFNGSMQYIFCTRDGDGIFLH